MISAEVQREDGSVLYVVLEGEAFTIRDSGSEGEFSPEATADIIHSALSGGCRRATIELEDCILVLPPSRVTNNHGTTRSVVAFDKVNGTCHSDYLSDANMAQIVKAGLLGVDDGAEYEAAAEIVKAWPSDVRPVP